MHEARLQHTEHARGQQRADRVCNQCQAQGFGQRYALQFHIYARSPVPGLWRDVFAALQRENQ
ncbi:hypothetical protein D3C80_1285310 [compost metagenome]